MRNNEKQQESITLGIPVASTDPSTVTLLILHNSIVVTQGTNTTITVCNKCSNSNMRMKG